MTEFKVGDRVRSGEGVKATVKAVFGDHIWLLLDGDDESPLTYHADGWEKVPDFFEVGKTYQFHPSVASVTRGLFLVERVDEDSDGSPVAYGKLTVNNRVTWIMRIPADWKQGYWKEVEEGW